tara:strand:+ start:53195 stop:53671 length:477 start_codon:yes stop_codon:yes gene_type:complete
VNKVSAVLKNNISIRDMKIDDVDKVFMNELHSFTYPWTKGIFHDCLRVGYNCLVAEFNNKIVGHAVLSASYGEAHLLNLSVAPDYQNNGIGRILLRRASRLAIEQGMDTIFLEVRISNVGAQSLYQSEGFCEVGRRNGYYPHATNGREDAIIYAKPIN